MIELKNQVPPTEDQTVDTPEPEKYPDEIQETPETPETSETEETPEEETETEETEETSQEPETKYEKTK